VMMTPELLSFRFSDGRHKVIRYNGDQLGFAYPDKMETLNKGAEYRLSRSFLLANDSQRILITAWTGFSKTEFSSGLWTGDLAIRDKKIWPR